MTETSSDSRHKISWLRQFSLSENSFGASVNYFTSLAHRLHVFGESLSGQDFRRNFRNVVVSLDWEYVVRSDHDLLLDPWVSGLNVTLPPETLSTRKCFGCIAAWLDNHAHMDT